MCEGELIMGNRLLDKLREKDKKGLFTPSQVSVNYPTGFAPFDYLNGYKVKVMVDALNIRSGPGTQYKINGCIRDCGVYTIVDTQNGWGRLKSDAGWICLDYTTRI